MNLNVYKLVVIGPIFFNSFTTGQNKIILQRNDIVGATIFINHRVQKDYDFLNFKDYRISIEKDFPVQLNTDNNSFKFAYNNPAVKTVSC